MRTNILCDISLERFESRCLAGKSCHLFAMCCGVQNEICAPFGSAFMHERTARHGSGSRSHGGHGE